MKDACNHVDARQRPGPDLSRPGTTAEGRRHGGDRGSATVPARGTGAGRPCSRAVIPAAGSCCGGHRRALDLGDPVPGFSRVAGEISRAGKIWGNPGCSGHRAATGRHAARCRCRPWRDAVDQTRAMLLTVTGSNLLDVPDMVELQVELIQHVRQGCRHPATAVGELAEIWNEVADRGEFLFRDSRSLSGERHPRPRSCPLMGQHGSRRRSTRCG